MLNDFDCHCPVYIACGYTDLRRGIDGMASIAQSQFRLDPFQRVLLLFCGRRQDSIKGLYWEEDGFLLLYKLLENGAFQWPRSKDEVRQLTPQQYRWLMEGLNIYQPKAHNPTNHNMTSNTEMVSISRAEYEEMQGKIQWLTEQLVLKKKKMFDTSSEQLDQMVID